MLRRHQRSCGVALQSGSSMFWTSSMSKIQIFKLWQWGRATSANHVSAVSCDVQWCHQWVEPKLTWERSSSFSSWTWSYFPFFLWDNNKKIFYFYFFSPLTNAREQVIKVGLRETEGGESVNDLMNPDMITDASVELFRVNKPDFTPSSVSSMRYEWPIQSIHEAESFRLKLLPQCLERQVYGHIFGQASKERRSIDFERQITLCGISLSCTPADVVSVFLSSFPNKMVLGRTHIKEVAAKRKVELSHYVHNLMRSSTEVVQVRSNTAAVFPCGGPALTPELCFSSVTWSTPSFILLHEMTGQKVWIPHPKHPVKTLS